jgi:aryl-alcohol dehydrogenase-like predicted oxidoreductase
MSLVMLGRTDMAISRAGLGTWSFAGAEGGWPHGWGSQDEETSIATIRAAVEAGINWIDTAAVYGRGRAECIIGRALREIPEADRPYVFTKAGRQWQDDDLGAPLRSVLTPATIRQEVEGSLRRLRTERLDLLQLHWPATDGTPVEEYWPVLADLRAEGKIRAAGLSNHWLAQLAAAQAVAQVDSAQLPLSLIKPAAAGLEAPWCREHGVGFLAYSPLQSGLLSGHMTRERVAQLPADDWRRKGADFTGERLEVNLRTGQRLARAAAERGVTPATLAVAWVLACPGVTAAIVGARRPGHLSDWLPALEYELTSDEAHRLAELTAGSTDPAGSAADRAVTDGARPGAGKDA